MGRWIDVREGREVRRLPFVGGPGLMRRADSNTRYVFKSVSAAH